MLSYALDSASLAQIVADSAAEVLETMFFTSLTGGAEPQVAADKEAVAARLTFRGEPSGFLSVVLSLRAANSIVASFVGVDESELDDETREQTVNELANIICGSILSRIESDSVFELGSPERVNPNVALSVDSETTPALRRSFDTGDGVLTVILGLEQTL